MSSCKPIYDLEHARRAGDIAGYAARLFSLPRGEDMKQFNRSDFTYTYDSYGYMLYFRGKCLGGAGTAKRERQHWRHARANLKWYRELAELEIASILRG